MVPRFQCSAKNRRRISASFSRDTVMAIPARAKPVGEDRGSYRPTPDVLGGFAPLDRDADLVVKRALRRTGPVEMQAHGAAIVQAVHIERNGKGLLLPEAHASPSSSVRAALGCIRSRHPRELPSSARPRPRHQNSNVRRLRGEGVTGIRFIVVVLSGGDGWRLHLGARRLAARAYARRVGQLLGPDPSRAGRGGRGTRADDRDDPLRPSGLRRWRNRAA